MLLLEECSVFHINKGTSDGEEGNRYWRNSDGSISLMNSMYLIEGKSNFRLLLDEI